MEKLEEMGVQSIHDIPADFELSEIQRRACRRYKQVSRGLART